MKRYIISAMIICLSCFSLQAQSDIDAFRFSQTNWQGTARFMGAGGAFGAVGAEYSALSINPASIGIYKKSEVSFTPIVVSFFNTSTTYEGNKANYLSSNYSLTNFGVVITAPLKNESAWKGVQFGIGYNRIHDYNNNFRIEGIGTSSIADQIADQANGTPCNQLSGDANIAFSTWAIDTFNGPSNYLSLMDGNEIKHKQSVRTTGAIDEMNLTVGGNYNDQLYIGATLGIPFLKYQEIVTHVEENMDELPLYLNELERKTNLHVKGTGINLKLGLIYQPADFMRIGIAFHTPTYYTLRETYNVTMGTEFWNGQLSKILGYNTNYSYRLVTPLKVNANLAFLIQKRAFISADYEFTNYGMAKMYASDYGFDDENANITDKYGAAHTIRVGAEVYLTSNFLIRLGYNYQSNPYKDNINDTRAHLAAVGLGFRTKSFFADLAYNLRLSKEDYWMYSSEYVNLAANSYNTNRVAITFGCKF